MARDLWARLLPVQLVRLSTNCELSMSCRLSRYKLMFLGRELEYGIKLPKYTILYWMYNTTLYWLYNTTLYWLYNTTCAIQNCSCKCIHNYRYYIPKLGLGYKVVLLYIIIVVLLYIIIVMLLYIITVVLLYIITIARIITHNAVSVI